MNRRKGEFKVGRIARRYGIWGIPEFGRTPDQSGCDACDLHRIVVLMYMSFIFIRIDFFSGLLAGEQFLIYRKPGKIVLRHTCTEHTLPKMRDENIKPSVIVEPATPILSFSDWCNPVT
jgi:hypothetical protein